MTRMFRPARRAGFLLCGRHQSPNWMLQICDYSRAGMGMGRGRDKGRQIIPPQPGMQRGLD
jgi:hypothetical protein